MEPEKYDNASFLPREVGSVTCFRREAVLTPEQVAEIRARIARED